MSTILKALRRLEEDKKTRAAMSLDSALIEPSKGPRKRGSQLGVSIAAGAVAAIGVMAILWSLSSFWMPVATGTADVASTPPGIAAASPEPAAPETITVPIAEAPRPAPAEPVPLARSTADARSDMFAKAAEVRREAQAGRGAPVPSAPALAQESAPEEKVAATTASLKAAAPGSAKESTSPPSPVAAATPPARTSVKRQTAGNEAAVAKGETKVAAPSPIVAPPVAAKPEPEQTPAPVRELAALPATPQPSSKLEPQPATKPEALTSPPAPSSAAAVPESASMLAVQQIIWHPTPSRRVAVFEVEGESVPQRIGEGGVVGGFTVAKIGLSDVELVRDGVAVKRRVGAN